MRSAGERGWAWRLAPWLVAAAGGALWARGFGVTPQVLAPWLALVPLLLLLEVGRLRTAFGLGWLHGTVFWLVSIPWIVPTLEVYGGVAPWLAWLLMLGLALYLGAYTALFAAGGALVRRRLSWPAALVALPALWVALELVRGWLFSGFPWNLAGYAWTDVAGALPLGAWIGAWGVSYLVLFANCGLALALSGTRSGSPSRSRGPRRWRGHPALAGLLVPLLLLVLGARFAGPGNADGALLSADRGHGRWAEIGGGASDLVGGPVRIVQPAIYNQVGYDAAVTRRDYTRLMRMTDQACDRPGALVVWPESAAWPFELERDPLLARDVERIADRGCSILLNSTHEVPRVTAPTGAEAEAGGEAPGQGLSDRSPSPLYFNSAYLVSPPAPGAATDRDAVPRGAPGAGNGDGFDGRGGLGAFPGTALPAVQAAVRYDKRHLVPFGEYVPLAGVFSFLDHLARNAGAYTAADRVTLLPWSPDGAPGGASDGAGAGEQERLGLAICFEVTFPGEVAELARAGATILVTMTNDAWYGDSAAPRQHFRAARWRAAETARPLLRAAITGISAVVGPDGSVRQSLGVGDTGILWSRVSGRRTMTPFVRAPSAVPTAAFLLSAFAIIAAARRSSPSRSIR